MASLGTIFVSSLNVRSIYSDGNTIDINDGLIIKNGLTVSGSVVVIDSTTFTGSVVFSSSISLSSPFTTSSGIFSTLVVSSVATFNSTINIRDVSLYTNSILNISGSLSIQSSLYITSNLIISGNFGGNIVNPTEKIDILGNIRVNANTNDGNAANIKIIKSRNSTTTNNNDEHGWLGFYGVDSSNNEQRSAHIYSVQDGNSGANFVPGALRFLTTNISGVESEHMRINNTGTVIIGKILEVSNTVISNNINITGNGTFFGVISSTLSITGRSTFNSVISSALFVTGTSSFSSIIVNGASTFNSTLIATNVLGVSATGIASPGFVRLIPYTNINYIQSGINDSADSKASLVFGGIGAVTEWMRIVSTGNVGIGTDIPSALLEVAGTIKATQFQTTSDKRIKTNIQPFTKDSILAVLSDIDIYQFNYKDSYLDTKTLDSALYKKNIGLIAQEVLPIAPELISRISTSEYSDILSVNQTHLMMLILGGVKELINENKKLKERITILENKN